MSVEAAGPQFLTTREVAALLRVKERKVYELAANNAIPCRRVTGKLLFPRDELEAWIAGGQEAMPAARAAAVPEISPAALPHVVAGSHDPLLEWALRESGSGLATFFDGSLDGLERLAAGGALACGMHVFEPERGDWNLARLAAALAGRPFAAIEWARRAQGLMVAPEAADAIAGMADLKGRRVVLRQPASGGRVLFDHLLKQAGLGADDLAIHTGLARTESEVAGILAAGEADAAIGLEAMARQFKLAFVPLIEERYDIVVHWGAYFDAPFQKLLGFCRTGEAAHKAAAMGGYDLAGLGSVRWNGG